MYLNPAHACLADDDVWLAGVDAHSHFIQFLQENIDCVRIKRVAHEHNKVCRAHDRQNFASPALSMRRALDYSGKVENLYLRAAVFQNARDDSKRGKVVGAHLAENVGNPIHYGAFSDAGKADHCDCRAPAFLKCIARPASAALRGALLGKLPKHGYLGAEPATMDLGLLVLLSTGVFVFQLFDLVFYRSHKGCIENLLKGISESRGFRMEAKSILPNAADKML